MISSLTVQPDPNISILQGFASDKTKYQQLEAFAAGKDLKLAVEFQDKLNLGFWNRLVVVILNAFSSELSAKKVASFVQGYMPQITVPIEREEKEEDRLQQNLEEFGLFALYEFLRETK